MQAYTTPERLTNVHLRRTPDEPPHMVTVELLNGRIERLMPQEDLQEQEEPNLRSNNTQVDCQGGFLVPGLINLHSHLFRKVRPDDHLPIGYEKSPVTLTLRALHNAADYLEAGVTTVRDVGSPADFDLALSELERSGLQGVPRIFGTGRPLTQTGGHNHDFAVVVDGPDNIRQAVRERMLTGVHWVKLMASQGGTRYFKGKISPAPPDTVDEAYELVEQILQHADPSKVYAPTERDGYTPEELTVAAEEATRLGIRTCAHAVTAQSIINCVDAGLTTVEHGTFLNDEATNSLASSDTVYVPTISTVFHRILHGKEQGWSDYLLRWAMYVAEPWFASLLLAKHHNVTVAVGTDAGGDMLLEMQLLERAGFSRHEVIKAATATAAEVLDRPDLGKIETGATADLVLLSSDPLEDLTAFQKPTMVLKAGRITTPLKV